MDKLHYGGPVVLAILDGVGLATNTNGNAVATARTPFLGYAAKHYPHLALNASGEAVGLLPGQMGNSEVGHNTMGVGHAVKQGIARINEAFATGEVYDSPAWHTAISRVKNSPDAVLHFSGIFSDGGVHSDIYYLEQMIDRAVGEGVTKIRVHAVFDGRDVPPFSAPDYIARFNSFAAKYQDADIKIASGGGRMVFVADRYESDWEIVARGWDAIVNGVADYYFKDPLDAITTLRRITPNLQDQNLPPFVITDSADQPLGRVHPGDSFIYFDFRADRAIEIAEAFTYWDFPHFNRGDYKPTDVYFVGLTEYNSDTHVPEFRLVEPVEFTDSLSDFLSHHHVTQLACSETVKFGHVTYYFNGNSYDAHPGEDFLEIESSHRPFETCPWMKSAEITDAVIERLPHYNFIRLTVPGGDMVGHTANFDATVLAIESIDLCLARLAQAIDDLGGVLLIIADHGNAEELLDSTGGAKTSHTTNKIPFIICDNTNNRDKYILNNIKAPGLSNLAATIATLLGLSDFPSTWDAPLIHLKK